jgi:hypothetical protein
MAGMNRAVEWIHGKLWNVCCELDCIAKQTGLERVYREKSSCGWISESVIDDFEQIDEYVSEIRRRNKEETEEFTADVFEGNIEYDDEWDEG